MKKHLCLFLCVLLGIFALPVRVTAQYYSSPSMTNFKPFRMPTVTVEQISDLYVSSELTFSGTVRRSDGVVSGYEGCLNHSDGSQFFGMYNPDFTVSEGGYNLYIPSTKDVAYVRQWSNGSWNVVQTYDIKGRSFVVNGTSITYADTYNSGGYSGGYSGGGYSGGSTSGSSSSSHSATCSGCHGSGKCQHCHGTGLVNNNRSRCSLCGGSGRCKSCGGVGKVYL